MYKRILETVLYGHIFKYGPRFFSNVCKKVVKIIIVENLNTTTTTRNCLLFGFFMYLLFCVDVFNYLEDRLQISKSQK